MTLRLHFILFCFLFTISSCKKEPVVKSGLKIISSFSLLKGDNGVLSNDIIGLIRSDTVYLNIPEGIPLNHLVPTIKISGISVSPESGTAQNFTTPVRYTVKAEDGSTQAFTVVTHLLSGKNSITSFILKKADNPSLVNDVTGIIQNDTILLRLPSTTGSAKLIPSISVDGGAISPDAFIEQDFTKALNYMVTAENGNIKTYKVLASANLLAVAGSSSGYLYALDALTGKLVWQYHPGGQISSPVCANGIIYAANENSFFALDQNTGKEKWINKSFAGTFTAASIMDGTVYAGYHTEKPYPSNHVYALDASTGAIKWQNVVLFSGYGYVSAPKAEDGMVYITEFNNGFVAINAVTGTTEWKLGGALSSHTPRILNGIAYFGSEGSLVTAVNIKDRTIIWKCRGINQHSTPAVNNNVVYVTGYDDIGPNLFAIDATNGKIIWRFQGAGGGLASIHGFFSSPYFFNGTVYAGDADNLLYAINGDGTLKWIYPTTQGIKLTLPNPVVTYGSVFVNREDEYFYCMDAATGILRWKFKGSAALNTNPCIVDTDGNAFYPGN